MSTGGPPLPAPKATPAWPVLKDLDNWLVHGAAPPKTVGVHPAYIVPLRTTVRVPDGCLLEGASAPFDANFASAEHELLAGAGETCQLQLEIGMAYSMRFRDAEGRVGAGTRVSAHGEPELCARWMHAVPRSVGQAALQAGVSLVRALESGEKMMRADVLLPGLNPRIENVCGQDERLLQLFSFEMARVLLASGRSAMLLYDSAGSAAGAQAAWKQLYGSPPPDAISFRGLTNKPVTRDEVRGLNTIGGDPNFRAAWDFSPAVSPTDPRDAYICVRPKNSRGDAVVLALMQAHAKVEGAAWLLINPELEDTALRGIFGMRETDKYMAFLKRFAHIYLARGMYLVQRPSMAVTERGHLGMRYGEGWVGLKRSADGFEEIARFEMQPTSNQIDSVSW